jgi:hypothetical protein
LSRTSQKAFLVAAADKCPSGDEARKLSLAQEVSAREITYSLGIFELDLSGGGGGNRRELATTFYNIDSKEVGAVYPVKDEDAEDDNVEAPVGKKHCACKASIRGFRQKESSWGPLAEATFSSVH